MGSSLAQFQLNAVNSYVNKWSVGWQVRELEGELEGEQRRHADAQKTVRRHERRIQELTQLSEDEEKARDAERETMEKLQSKMKQYKRELDDAVSAIVLSFSITFYVRPISNFHIFTFIFTSDAKCQKF